MITQGQQAYGVGQQAYLPKLQDLQIQRSRLTQCQVYKNTDYKKHIGYHRDIQNKINIIDKDLK